MILVTDKFHEGKWNGQKKGHVNCPSAFSVDYWKECSEIKDWHRYNDLINTSTAEQINAKLRNLQKHIRCAKLSNAIEWIKKFFEVHNLMMNKLCSSRHTKTN